MSTKRPGVEIEVEKGKRVKSEDDNETIQSLRDIPETKEERKRRLNRERKRKQREDPVYRQKEIDKLNTKYATDPEFREKAIRKAKEAWQKKKLAGLTSACVKLDFTPDSALLKWLGASEDLKDEKSKLNFKDYLQNLPLTDLLQKFPTFVDEKFLRNKNYCVYVDTLYAWPELKDKNLSEIEDIVRKHSGDNSKIQYEYVGKHSNGLCSRPGHKWDPKSAIYKFLKKNQNGRAFNSWIFDCNSLGMKTATGDRLRKMIARAECQMNAVEAFLIHFMKQREKIPSEGMRHVCINRKMEPLRKELKKDALKLAEEAPLFDYTGIKNAPDYGFIFNGNIPFRLYNEIKRKPKINVIS